MKHLLLLLTLLLMPLALSAQTNAPPCCSLGDVNGDGVVTVTDRTELRRHLLGLTCLNGVAQCNGDVDGNGILTEADADLINEFVLAEIETFPRCGDFDRDGSLDWRGDDDGDLDRLTGCVLGTARCSRAYDGNGDGIVNIQDVFIFLDHADGRIHDFPGCACGAGACASTGEKPAPPTKP